MYANFLNQFKLLTVVLLLALPKVAWMSQLHYEKINFDEMANMARGIVVVKRVANASIKKSMPIRKLGKIYRPFKFVVHNYQVVRVLRGEDVTEGSVVEVYPAEFDNELKRYRKYVTIGMSISPLYRRYQPQAYEENDAVFLLFLSYTKDRHWSYYCRDSREGLAYEERISMLGHKKTSR